MSCNYYQGKCLFLNGKEDGCKGCPIKKAYNKGVRDTKKDYERPTGKWEKVIDHYQDKVVFRCSICGRFVRDCYRDDLAELYPYCNCGAKMEA